MNLTLQHKGDWSLKRLGIREYFTPAQYFDPRKEILSRKNADLKNRPHQGKFKATVKHKPCFMDQQVKPFLENPSPDKYKTITNREGFFENDRPVIKKIVIAERKSKSTGSLKVQPMNKRHTFFDDIEKSEAKYKHPGVGQFDITKDPYKKTHVVLKPKSLPLKFNNLDDITYVSSRIPGPGSYNPHKSVPHLKPVDTDIKFYQTKHAEIEARRAKVLAARVGPSTYCPMQSNTFQEIAKNKKKERSKWSHGAIDIRQGLRSFYKSPGPSDHSLMNQWVPTKSHERESPLGKVKLLDRTTRSTKSLSVYH